MEIFTTIALLCSIQIGAMGVKIEEIRKEQIECHKYYAECIGNNIGSAFESSKFKECIKDRK